MSNFKTGALPLLFLIGFCHLSAGQAPPDPLLEPAALQPDAPLPAPAPAGTEEVMTNDTLTPPRDLPSVPLEPTENLPPPQSDIPKWHLHLRLETTVTYDDNIFIQPTQKQSDVYFGITPIIAAGWGTFQADPTTVTGMTSRFPQLAAREVTGDSFLFRYAPTAMLFVHHRDQDAVDQDAMLGGRWITGKLTLDMAGRFQTLSAPDIDVGNRINSQVTSGFLNANYQMTERTSLDSRFALEHDSYQGGLDSTDINFTTLLDYQVLPKTLVGVGAGVGYTTVESGENQYYEQGLLHVRYEPTFKLTLEGTVGMEVREIENGANHTTPVFEFTASYALQDSTSIRLSASRRTETSALYVDQDIERTTLEASIRQRFFQKVYVTLSGGYQWIDYTDAGATANRNDNYAYVGLESALEVTKWLSLRASYRYQDNNSSNGDFSFRRNLADFHVNIEF